MNLLVTENGSYKIYHTDTPFCYGLSLRDLASISNLPFAFSKGNPGCLICVPSNWDNYFLDLLVEEKSLFEGDFSLSDGITRILPILKRISRVSRRAKRNELCTRVVLIKGNTALYFRKNGVVEYMSKETMFFNNASCALILRDALNFREENGLTYKECFLKAVHEIEERFREIYPAYYEIDVTAETITPIG